MSKKVLLTGAGGSIGCHLLHKILTDTDWTVVITDSFRDEHKGYLDRITQVYAWVPDEFYRVTRLVHDLTVPFSDREAEKLSDVDFVINLASMSDVQDSIENPVPFVRNNVDIALNMLELARVIKPEAFIQFSTDEVYGCDAPDGTGHKEWSVIKPSNPYSASKAMQEDIAIAYWRSFGVPLIITNTMNQFGEMQSGSKYPVKIQKTIEAGETVTVHSLADGALGSRFYIHSESSAESILFILKNTTPTLHSPGSDDLPDRYNVVGDQRIDNLELAKIIAELMGKELKYELVNFHDSNPGHDSHYGLDGTRLHELGFRPSNTLKELLKRTIEWQQQNPEWMK